MEETNTGAAEKNTQPQPASPAEQRGTYRSAPLYGVKGWLLLFMLPMILLGIAFLFNYGFVFSNALPMLFSGDAAQAWALLGTGTLSYLPLIVAILVTLAKLFHGDITFRYWYVAYAALTLLNGILTAAKVPGNLVGYFIYPAFVAVGCVYLFRSDRVRVTCGLPPLHSRGPLQPVQPYPKMKMPIESRREREQAAAEEAARQAAPDSGEQ